MIRYIFSAVIPFVLVFSGAYAETRSAQLTVQGARVKYKVVLPDSFDPDQIYPAILAFPGGGQGPRLVEAGLDLYWRDEAEKRGYIVIAPEAPRGQLFFQKGANVFPEFLNQVTAMYPIDTHQVHIAGISNGGLSAYHIAAKMPGRFKSVMGLPGQFPDLRAVDDEALEALKTACFTMYVGGADTPWRRAMAAQAEVLKNAGFRIRFVVEPGEGHVMQSIAGKGAARLFDRFEAAEACPA